MSEAGDKMLIFPSSLNLSQIFILPIASLHGFPSIAFGNGADCYSHKLADCQFIFSQEPRQTNFRKQEVESVVGPAFVKGKLGGGTEPTSQGFRPGEMRKVHIESARKIHFVIQDWLLQGRANL